VKDADGEGIYVLAATVADPEECEPIRDRLRSLLVGKARRLHWHTESARRRRLVAVALAECGASHTVVIGAPLAARKPERARRLCLERLVVGLAALEVSHVLVESRTQRDNARDAALFDALRSARVLTAPMTVDFALPTAEPMLWFPDVVAGAVGARRRGEDEAPWFSLRGTVREIDLRLS